MDSLKLKLAAMRESVSEAEEREDTAKIQAKSAHERKARADDEAAHLRRRLAFVQKELNKVEDSTDEKLDRLERLKKHIYENENSRQRMERKEMKEDTTLSHLESRQKSRQLFVQDSEQKLREASNRLRMLEADVARVDARIEAAVKREECLKKMIHDAGRTAGSLARSGEFKNAKCDDYRERCRCLSERKEKVLITAECLERKALQLENNLVPLRDETEAARKRALAGKRELRDMLDAMNIYP